MKAKTLQPDAPGSSVQLLWSASFTYHPCNSDSRAVEWGHQWHLPHTMPVGMKRVICCQHLEECLAWRNHSVSVSYQDSSSLEISFLWLQRAPPGEAGSTAEQLSSACCDPAMPGARCSFYPCHQTQIKLEGKALQENKDTREFPSDRHRPRQKELCEHEPYIQKSLDNTLLCYIAWVHGTQRRCKYRRTIADISGFAVILPVADCLPNCLRLRPWIHITKRGEY